MGRRTPATRGSVVSVYGAGFGLTSPACVPGALALPPAASLTLSVEIDIGGAAGEVLFAGSASGLLCCVEEFDVRVPDQIPEASGRPGAVSPVSVNFQTTTDTGIPESSSIFGMIYVK